MTREPPQTEEGWYALHDLRRIDWDAWRDAPDHERDRALVDGVDYLQFYEDVADVAERRSASRQTKSDDAGEGQTAVYTVQGHKADLMIVHLRPTMADVDAAERQFEQTAFAQFTERASSYVSVTEASGYSERAREYFDGEVDEESGLAKYIQGRLHPEIPDDEFVSFYPMSKRRRPEQNWYDLPFDERAEHIESHGNIGKEYGGKVQQMITGSMGLDDWEWGVTLWTDDLTHVKDLLTQMRFDPSTSKFAEFGQFYVGRRFPPEDLPAVLAGERVPTDDERTDAAHAGDGERVANAAANGHGSDAGGQETATSAHAAGDADGSGGAHPGSAGEGDHPHGSEEEADGDEAGGSGGRPPTGGGEFAEVDDAAQRLGTLGLSEGEDYDAGDYALVFHSTADARELAEEVEGLRGNFDHYDRHVLTSVRAQSGRAAVVSVWTAKEAAETAAGFLADLPGVDEKYGGHLGTDDDSADDVGDSGVDASAETGDADAQAESIREQLADLDVYAGKPHGEDVYALVLYSTADANELSSEVETLRDRFDRYDTHVKSAVYENVSGEGLAVVSLWDTQDAADTASEYLADLPGVVGRPDEEDGFGTMGMFYTVKPDHREEFVDTFGEVGELLAEMDGHRDTALLANREDENDMFISSQWDAREDAMEFFRSDAFAETVQWGREVLDDRPRHVFLA